MSWIVFDADSKRLAATENIAGKDYNGNAKWIDDRHHIIYGTLDYKPLIKDDPMGLALFADCPLLELANDPSPPASAAADVKSWTWTLSRRDRGMARATAAAIIAMARGISPEIVRRKRP